MPSGSSLRLVWLAMMIADCGQKGEKDCSLMVSEQITDSQLKAQRCCGRASKVYGSC